MGASLTMTRPDWTRMKREGAFQLWVEGGSGVRVRGGDVVG